MIEVNDLRKYFLGNDGNKVWAVNGVTFQAKQGEILGLLGPNGAGKTTTLRILCTLLKPSGGYARVAGFDVQTQAAQVRRHIGFLSSNTGIYDRMTPRELILYYAKLHELGPHDAQQRVSHLIETLQMGDFADIPGSRLSTGQKQKTSVARALVHDPEVLIFDEPTLGLDVMVQRTVLQTIRELKDRGKCIILSTHIFREVEKLCDRVVIIHRGQVLANDTLDQLRLANQENDLEELFFKLVGTN